MMGGANEAKPVYKVLLFPKRRPGMSVEAFRDYYENTHVKLGEKYSQGLLHYVRRYLDPVGDEELPFDVITELWLKDRAAAEAIAAQTAKDQRWVPSTSWRPTVEDTAKGSKHP